MHKKCTNVLYILFNLVDDFPNACLHNNMHTASYSSGHHGTATYSYLLAYCLIISILVSCVVYKLNKHISIQYL